MHSTPQRPPAASVPVARPLAIRSRRRPKLKVVGAPLESTPHAIGFGTPRGDFRIQLWTRDEWEKLHPAERPANAARVPGLPGMMAAIWLISEEERLDLQDIQRQLSELAEEGVLP